MFLIGGKMKYLFAFLAMCFLVGCIWLIRKLRKPPDDDYKDIEQEIVDFYERWR